MARELIGYNVYRAADGCDEEYYGFAETLDEAIEMAKTSTRLPAHLYETARAAGSCGGKHAPEKVNEGAVAEWFGEDGFDCAVEVFAERSEAK